MGEKTFRSHREVFLPYGPQCSHLQNHPWAPPALAAPRAVSRSDKQTCSPELALLCGARLGASPSSASQKCPDRTHGKLQGPDQLNRPRCVASSVPCQDSNPFRSYSNSMRGALWPSPYRGGTPSLALQHDTHCKLRDYRLGRFPASVTKLGSGSLGDRCGSRATMLPLKLPGCSEEGIQTCC